MREKINQWCMQEYGTGADFENIFEIPIAYTTDGEGRDVQVYFDLVDGRIWREVDGEETDSYEDVTEEDWDWFTFEGLTLGGWF